MQELGEELPFRVVETREKGNRIVRKVYFAAPQGAVLPLLVVRQGANTRRFAAATAEAMALQAPCEKPIYIWGLASRHGREADRLKRVLAKAVQKIAGTKGAPRFETRECAPAAKAAQHHSPKLKSAT